MIDQESLEVSGSAIRAGNMPKAHHVPKDCRKKIQCQRIGAKDYKWLRPPPMILDFNQPIARSEKKKRNSSREEDIRAAPERLVNGKPGIPDPTHHESAGARNKHPRTLGQRRTRPPHAMT